MARIATCARAAVPDVWTVIVTGLVLAPQFHAGYGFAHDMVFTASQPLKLESIGLGTALPRAVPLDALVALFGHLVGGQMTGRIALFVPLLAAGWGARRLLGSNNLAASVFVAGMAVWNPFVVERLALGQWALLWAYGALPWLIRAAWRIREELSVTTVAGLVVAIAASSITPTGALIALAVSIVMGVGQRRPAANSIVVGTAIAFQLPWLLPALTGPASGTSDSAAVSVFAARSEHVGGALTSLLGLGGIWDADVMPASRSGALGLLSAGVVLAAIAFGARRLLHRFGLGFSARLAVLAFMSFAVAGAATIPGGDAVVRWGVRVVPGAGLLRDGQKWLLPFALLAVVVGGAALERIDMPRWQTITVLLGLALPFLLLPDAMATLHTPLMPVQYSSDWQVAAKMARGPDDALALPFAAYHSYPWAPGRTVIDPAPRWLSVPTVVDDELVVSGRTLRGEDPRARQIKGLIARHGADPQAFHADLANAGVRWVLVEVGASGPPLPDLGGLRLVYSGLSVQLYEVTGPIAVAASAQTARKYVIVAVDMLVLALVLASGLLIGARRAVRLVHLTKSAIGGC